MKQAVVGWDIGGAHVKAALLGPQREIIRVIQVVCPLWKGIAYLHQAIAAVLQEFAANDVVHVMTMTGELADCFTDRRQGVTAIIAAMQSHIDRQSLWVYSNGYGFLAADAVQAEHVMAIASVNWLASAELTAKHAATALFVDIGSTTTDLILIEQHRLQVQGYSDYDRLVSGELLYTGIVRTAVMAIAQQAEFRGRQMGLMAEYFATMADVYRLTGDLNPEHDQADTADGAEKTPIASARRLSRMTGYEFDQADWQVWLEFAGYLKNRQKQLILDACNRQIRRSLNPQHLILIGAGVGRFLLREIALELGLAYRDFVEFVAGSDAAVIAAAADCAPAVAVAILGAGFVENRPLV